MISAREAISIKPSETWVGLDGKEKGLPLFNDGELPIAEDLINKMCGLNIREANEFLDKFKTYLNQAFTL